jgi:hypothetical protein
MNKKMKENKIKYEKIEKYKWFDEIYMHIKENIKNRTKKKKILDEFMKFVPEKSVHFQNNKKTKINYNKKIMDFFNKKFTGKQIGK